jgi:hypothetical protein
MSTLSDYTDISTIDLQSLVDTAWIFKEKYSYSPYELFLVVAHLFTDKRFSKDKIFGYLEDYFKLGTSQCLVYYAFPETEPKFLRNMRGVA